jgi:hypothetical protein
MTSDAASYRETLSKLVNHRYFFRVTPLLLLLVLVAIGIAVTGTKAYTASMETYRSRGVWSNKTTAHGDRSRGASEEFVWWLRDVTNSVFGSTGDHDRVYLRMEGGGIQTIVIKTSKTHEKKNNTISFTVTEFDALSTLLADNGTIQTNQTIYNGRRRVLMEKLPAEEELIRLTVVKYVPKNSTWIVRHSIKLTHPKINILMNIYKTKIHAKITSYEERIGATMAPDDDDDGDYRSEATHHPIPTPKSRRLDTATASVSMDSSELPGTTAMSTEEH